MPRINNQTKTDFEVNAIASVTFPAMNGRRWRLLKVIATYSDSSVSGTVKVLSNATEILTADGSGVDLDFGSFGGLQQPTHNQDLIVTLPAGGAAITGRLTAIAFPE